MNVKRIVKFRNQNLVHTDPEDEEKIIISLEVGQSMFVERNRYYIINVQYNKDIDQEILVDNEPIFNYQIPNNFNIYYFDGLNYMFIDAPKKIANSFVKDLEELYEEFFEFENANFNFLRISQEDTYNAKGAWFNTNQVTVTSKAFYGNEIIDDAEVEDALRENRVSYFMVRFDIGNRANTVGISRNGAIVIYNNCPTDEDYIQLAALAFHEVINL